LKKPFRYRRVQRVRAIEEELAREEFLTSERIARQAEEATQAMQAEIQRAQRELSETRLFRRVPPHELLTAQTTLESLSRTLTEQRRRARDLKTQAETLRASWERARADERALERLEARTAAAWREEQRLAEARALDEVALRPPGDGTPRPDSVLRDPSGGPASSPGRLLADEQGPLHRA